MGGKVILYISMSLDGYIADDAGGIGWLGGRDPLYEGDYGYEAFFRGIDTVVMGWNTYWQVETQLAPGEWPYREKETYVLTHRRLPDRAGIHFSQGPAGELISALRKQGNVWICGGGNLVGQMLDLIDEFHLSVMPVLLGGGVRLFPEGDTHRLTLLSAEEENGVLNCIYRKERP